ncbi:MAG: DUF4358 domain-containing protein [Bacilli bacterium]|nr:DUF4358 domain-containing protein [Bacilli bacterium]
MKKILLILGLMFLITGCGDKVIEEPGDDLLDKIYAGYTDEIVLGRTVIDSENVEYYLGTSDIEFEEAVASEPMMTSIAHSVVLLKVKDGANKQDIMTKIKNNVNPNKWICVGVDPSNVRVHENGNLILLVMTDEKPDLLVDNFMKLK